MRELSLLLLCAIGFLLALSGAAPYTVTAQDQSATSFGVEQVHVNLPEITAFLSIRDASEAFVDTIGKDQLDVTIGEASGDVQQLSTFTDATEGVAYIFLVDISAAIDADRYGEMRALLQRWTNEIGVDDRAAIMTFGRSVELVQDFTSEDEALNEVIAELSPTDDLSRLYSGIVRATQLAQRYDAELPKRRVIVTLSDGINEVTGDVTAEEVYEQIGTDRVPMYSVGYPALARARALDQVGAFARTSGGWHTEARWYNSIDHKFSDVYARIQQVHVVEIACTECVADGEYRRFRTVLSSGDTTFDDGFEIQMRATNEAKASGPLAANDVGEETQRESPSQMNQDEAGAEAFPERIPWWGYAAGVLLILIIAWLIYYRYYRAEPEDMSGKEELPSPIILKKKERKEPQGIPLYFDVVGSSDGRYSANLVDRVIIGRSATKSDVVLSEDIEASRANSEVFLRDGQLYIQDLDSQNGTLVNGVPIAGSYVLEDGDRITVGRTELRIDFPKSEIKVR